MDSSAMQWGCFLNAFAFALFLSNSVPEKGKGLCEGQQATINCLKKNFRELYQKDYKQFWNILRSAEVKALRCHPISRSEEHTSELQSRGHLVCRLLLEKKKLTLPS